MAANADGRLELFALSGDRKVFHKWQVARNSNWGDWSSLGSPPEGILGNIAVVRDGRGLDGKGCLNVFAVCSDRSIHGISQVSPNGGWGQWQLIWPSNGALSSTPALAVNPGRKIELFATATDSPSGAYHMWQQQIGGSWSNWVKHGGIISPDGGLTLSASADGRLELFVNVQGGLFHKWQHAVNSTWSGWVEHERRGHAFDNVPSLAQHHGGRLELRIPATDGVLYGKTQVDANKQFGPWFPDPIPGIGVDGNGPRRPAIALNADRRLELFACAGNGSVYHKTQTARDGGWSNWVSRGAP